MSASYDVRLVCLCLASFFLVNAAVGAVVHLLSSFAIRRAEQVPARLAERLLLALRLFPAAVALFFLSALCVPSYISFEPDFTRERMGFLCVLAAFLGAAVWISSIARSVKAIVQTRRQAGACNRDGAKLKFADRVPPVSIVEIEAPLLAVAGVFHPRVVVSRGILRKLSPDQLSVALSHEIAHVRSLDNLKRFALLIAPDVLPFSRSFAKLDESWKNFAEWAADRDATGGNALASVSLAEALLMVTRMGAARQVSPLLTPFAPADQGLAPRLDRLLSPRSESTASHRALVGVFSVAIAAACLLALFASRPETLLFVHQLLERLVG